MSGKYYSRVAMAGDREREADLIIGFPALLCQSVDDTAALAETLAGEVRGGLAIILSGELGAGKTTFTRILAGALGIEGVKSPTFTTESIHRIPNRDFDLVHADLYRFVSVPPGSDTDLQFTEYLGTGEALLVVEWGDRWIQPPDDRWNIDILLPDDSSDDHRSFFMSAWGDDASRRLSRAYEAILDLPVAGRFREPC